jgi:putative transposase
VNKMLGLVQQSAAASKLEIPQAQRRAAALPLQAYERKHWHDRNVAIQAAFATGSYTMAQLSEHFGIPYTSVRRIVKMV